MLLSAPYKSWQLGHPHKRQQFLLVGQYFPSLAAFDRFMVSSDDMKLEAKSVGDWNTNCR